MSFEGKDTEEESPDQNNRGETDGTTGDIFTDAERFAEQDGKRFCLREERTSDTDKYDLFRIAVEECDKAEACYQLRNNSGPAAGWSREAMWVSNTLLYGIL